MQNWAHVETIFDVLNEMPHDATKSDFSRVRPWSLEGWARHFRQTVLLSGFKTPEINRVFLKRCSNFSGRIMNQPFYSGSIAEVVGRVPQVFRQIETSSLAKLPEDRFQHFVEEILPRYEVPL